MIVNFYIPPFKNSDLQMPVIVHELIAIELWREKVYPPLVALDFAAKSTITPYMVVRTENQCMLSLLLKFQLFW